MTHYRHDKTPVKIYFVQSSIAGVVDKQHDGETTAGVHGTAMNYLKYGTIKTSSMCGVRHAPDDPETILSKQSFGAADVWLSSDSTGYGG